MSSDTDILKEIGRLLLQRKKKAAEVQALDRKLEELAGVSSQREYKTKALSPKDMRAACGV